MTKRRKVIIAILIIAVVGVAIWGLVPVQPVGLTVAIALDSDTFVEGDEIVLHARIVNDSDKAAKILEPSLADITFEVALFDERGTRYDYLGPYSVKPFGRNAGRYLNPGETVTLEVALDKFFALPAGRYRVAAAYRTLNYPRVRVPFCRIPSNELTFELLPSE